MAAPQIEAQNLSVFESMAAMPWVYLFTSLACNLSCPYCSQRDTRAARGRQGYDGMSPEEMRAFYSNIGPAHFYISGGEPFLYEYIAPLVSGLMAHGHMVSFASNLTLPLETLRGYLAAWPGEQLGFFNITHHHTQVPLGEMLPRLLLLKEAGIRVWVRLIAVPNTLDRISDYTAQLRELDIGVVVASLLGHYLGKTYPDAYSEADIDRIVDMVTINSEGLNLFEGLYSYGMPCRAGNDVIGLRMYHEQPYIPCCRSELNPIELSDTYFGGQPKQTRPCRVSHCQGLLNIGIGWSRVHSEIERLARLASGHSPPVGREAFWAYLQDLTGRGYQLVNQSALLKYQQRWGLDLPGLRRTWRHSLRLPLKKARKCNQQVEASYGWGRLRVASLPRQWAYICQLDLAPLGPLNGACQVEVELEVQKGLLGVGLLHQSQEFFLREVEVASSPHKQSITLELPDASQAHALVLRTCAPEGQVTQAVIRQARVRC